MKLLYLSIISFVFIVSVSLNLSATSIPGIPEKEKENVKLPREVNVNPLPILTNQNFFPVLSSQGVVAIDLDSQVSLYEKNPDFPLLPASTTKIMTALVAMEGYPKDYVIEVGELIIDGQRMRLVQGEKIIVDNLLYGLLVFSANDAAETLARGYPGGRESFIAAMNLKAKSLHLDKTHFVNPTGLDEENHYSTARDMVRLSEVAMQNLHFSEIVKTREIKVTSVDGKIVHRLKNINELLGQVDGVAGVKTGWTQNARENLVTYINRDGHRVLIATLGSQDRFGETKELIDWIFGNYKWQEITYSP